jgi:hypothetical protein
LVTEKPYSETIADDCIVRKFSQDIDPIELMWHRDLKNRSVKLISGTGWKIQLDDQLPLNLTEIIIPKLSWHRVIKGTGDLIVEIREWD